MTSAGSYMAGTTAEESLTAVLSDSGGNSAARGTPEQLEEGMETETMQKVTMETPDTPQSVLDIQRGEADPPQDEGDDDSGTDYDTGVTPGTSLKRAERVGGSILPDTFQTNHLLFYERFKAYQDYMLGDCKTSEVKAFIVDYLEKVVEPCDWKALWSTEVFDVLVEVCF